MTIRKHRRVIELRNKLIHGYARVDDRLLWDVVESKLPNPGPRGRETAERGLNGPPLPRPRHEARRRPNGLGWSVARRQQSVQHPTCSRALTTYVIPSHGRRGPPD